VLGGPYGVAISANDVRHPVHEESVSEFDITNPAAAAYVGSWGTKGAGNGQLNRPLGIAVDGAGLVYVDDYGNGRIEVFTPPAVKRPELKLHRRIHAARRAGLFGPVRRACHIIGQGRISAPRPPSLSDHARPGW